MAQPLCYNQSKLFEGLHVRSPMYHVSTIFLAWEARWGWGADEIYARYMRV
jgi:hypothetical protein